MGKDGTGTGTGTEWDGVACPQMLRNAVHEDIANSSLLMQVIVTLLNTPLISHKQVRSVMGRKKSSSGRHDESLQKVNMATSK